MGLGQVATSGGRCWLLELFRLSLKGMAQAIDPPKGAQLLDALELCSARILGLYRRGAAQMPDSPGRTAFHSLAY